MWCKLQRKQDHVHVPSLSASYPVLLTLQPWNLVLQVPPWSEGADASGGGAAAEGVPQRSVGSKVGSLGVEEHPSIFLCSFASSLQPSDGGWDRAVKQECGSKEKEHRYWGLREKSWGEHLSLTWEIGWRQLGSLSFERGEQPLFTKMDGGGKKKPNWGSIQVGHGRGVKQDISVSQMKAVQCPHWSLKFNSVYY